MLQPLEYLTRNSKLVSSNLVDHYLVNLKNLYSTQLLLSVELHDVPVLVSHSRDVTCSTPLSNSEAADNYLPGIGDIWIRR